jgi:hypothetical protein
MKNLYFIISVLIFLVAGGCMNKKNKEKVVEADTGKEIVRNADPDSVSFYLEKMVTQMESDHDYRVEGQLIFSYHILPEFYKKRHYKWAWHEKINRREAADALSKSWRDGLSPEYYHFDQIMELAN